MLTLLYLGIIQSIHVKWPKLLTSNESYTKEDYSGSIQISCKSQINKEQTECLYSLFLSHSISSYKFLSSQILELVDFRVTEGLTDLRLFAVVASLAQKIATLEWVDISSGWPTPIHTTHNSVVRAVTDLK